MLEYSELVHDHFERPRNAGSLCGDNVFAGRAGRRADGNSIAFDLRIVDGVVASASFRAYGCPHTIAMASWLTGELAGRSAEEAGRLDLDGVQAALGLPDDKLGLVIVAEDALRAAVQNWRAGRRSNTEPCPEETEA